MDAIRAFEARKPDLVGTFSYLDMWREEHATSFTVAKSAGFDILKDISDGFERALKEGRTPRDFARDLRPLLQAKGWWGKKLLEDPQTGDLVAAQLGSDRRLQTIFDANMRTSYAAGHWAGFEQNKRGRPFLRYVALLDDRTRPAHRARHNLVLSVDHPYWDEWAPPCGWNCRCTIQSLSQRDVDQLQAEGEDLRFEAPEDTFRNFLNRRTGEITRVPDGIDPGWAYNPGRAAYEARINQSLAEKIADAPLIFITAAVDERLSSVAFERFLRNPKGSMPVMAIPEAISEALGRDVRVALLSSEIMQKQARRYPELTPADYRAIPSIGGEPTLVFQDKERTFVSTKLADGRWRYIALKLTATGKTAYLTSFRFAREENIVRLLERGDVKLLLDRRE
ncbi:phage putative head morphogenesis protein, SPP1 gp7 family [Rhizobium sp. NFR12]|nr:phage putative head morphogenesis protein, SPP1 gp7 family [Rhizobium sp. NFR12]